MPKFKIGLVGGGRMGQMHLRALAKSERVEIFSVVEPFTATALKLNSLGYATFKIGRAHV